MSAELKSIEPHETVGAALAGVITAGQHVLVDRIDLALFEWRHSLGQVAVKLALLIFGGLLLLGALIVLDVALVDWLGRSASRATALLCCAALHVVAGGALLFAGSRRRPSEVTR